VIDRAVLSLYFRLHASALARLLYPSDAGARANAIQRLAVVLSAPVLLAILCAAVVAKRLIGEFPGGIELGVLIAGAALAVWSWMRWSISRMTAGRTAGTVAQDLEGDVVAGRVGSALEAIGFMSILLDGFLLYFLGGN